MSSPGLPKNAGKPASGSTPLMRFAAKTSALLMGRLKRAKAFFTEREAASFEEAPPQNLPPLTPEAEKAIRRKMTAAQLGDYMMAMVIEGLQRRQDMPREELEERERKWQAKRVEYLSAIQAIQQSPAKRPAWAEKILDQFERNLGGGQPAHPIKEPSEKPMS